MRLLVVGAGATGGYFGGRLVAAGRDVTFLVRPARAARIAERGLEIVSPYGDVTVRPKLVTAAELSGPFDAILLTVKSFGLAAALDDIAPAVGPDTVILPVLNGMRHLDILTERFGAKAVGGGVCKIAATLDDEGRVVQLSDLQYLAYGELDGRPSERMRRIDEAMTGAGFPAQLSASIAREMWEKWLMLASLGAATCLMRGSIGEIVAIPGGREQILALIDEVAAIIGEVGVAPSEAALAATRTMLTRDGSPLASSMYRDLIKGGAIEADTIIGDLVRRGREAGVSTPLLGAANTHLAVYVARRAG
jgi:2-dehydropantoate 2-reductase